jgi:uncharacterized repeat protein (TIGR03803 family)
MIYGRDGNFYGTTETGGPGGSGTIFKMTSGGVLTTLHDFSSDDKDSALGGELFEGIDGDLYGTTRMGYLTNGHGSIYRMLFPGPPKVFLQQPVEITATSATVLCEVIPRGVSTSVYIDYGTNGDFTNTLIIPSSFIGYDRILIGRTLWGLSPGTTYYYRFRAVCGVGLTLSPTQSISTLAEPLVTATSPTEIGPTSARLNGTVNARNYDATVRIEWGTDGNSFPYTVAATPATVSGNTDTVITAVLTGLTRGAAYYYRVVGGNLGGTGVSGTQSFKTLTRPTSTIGGSFALSATSVRVEVFQELVSWIWRCIGRRPVGRVCG